MGDSITAANGARATNVFDVLTEYRGRAFRCCTVSYCGVQNNDLLTWLKESSFYVSSYY